MKKEKKENKSNLKIKTSIRLSFFSSLNSCSVGHNGHCAPISAAVLLLSGRCL